MQRVWRQCPYNSTESFSASVHNALDPGLLGATLFLSKAVSSKRLAIRTTNEIHDIRQSRMAASHRKNSTDTIN